MKNRMSQWLVFFALWAVSAFAQADAVPKFQGFDGGFIKFGAINAGYRDFEIRVDYTPWHFVAKGVINAGPQTSDLDIVTETIGIAIGYYPESFPDANGVAQNSSIVDVQVFVDDEPTRIKNLQIELLSPADGAPAKTALAAALTKFKAYAAAVPPADRADKESSAITTALADPMNKASKDAEIKAVAAKAQRAKQDSIAAAQAVQARAIKAQKDSATAAQAAQNRALRAQQDSIAAANAPKPKKKKAVVETVDETVATDATGTSQVATQDDRTQVSDASGTSSSDDSGAPIKKKKKKKKKKVVVDEEEDATDDSGLRTSQTIETPDDDQGHTGSGSNRRKLGIGLAITGGVGVLYGIYEHSVVSDRSSKMTTIETTAPAWVANPNVVYAPYQKSYTDLSNEKSGAETQRAIGLVLGAFCIAGSVVLLRF